MAWAAIAILAALLTAWAAIRKGVSGLPLIIGIWWLIATALLAVHWFPPLPHQILILGIMAGNAIMLVTWGIINIIIQVMFYSSDFTVKESIKEDTIISLQKKPKTHYAVLYGSIPWNATGANFFHDFINRNIWFKGLKITSLNVELDKSAEVRIAWIWGLVEPKTFIDRILY